MFGSTHAINVIDVLLDMRRYRMGLIQTSEQLRFSYLAIIEGSKMLSLQNPNDNEVPFSANNNLNKCKPHSPKIQRSMGINEEDFDTENGLNTFIVDNIIGNNDNHLVNNDIELPSTLPPLPLRSRRSFSTTSQSSSTSPEPDVKPTESDSVSSVPQDMISSEDKANHIELTNTSNNSKTDSSLNKEQELRNRLREEKRRKTADTIERIKKKAKESEERSRLKKNLIKYSLISVGFALLFGTGIFIYSSLLSGDISVNTAPNDEL